jgi:hypothetical protein
MTILSRISRPDSTKLDYELLESVQYNPEWDNWKKLMENDRKVDKSDTFRINPLDKERVRRDAQNGKPD